MHPRRILRPKDNVGEIIKGVRGRDEAVKKRYTIHTEIEPGSQGAGTELAMDVVEANNSAVTLETKVKDENGNEFTVGDGILLYTLLVTDLDTATGADTFAILAVNPETDDMHGIVEKRGMHGEPVPYKIKQSRGENQGKAMASEEKDLPIPDWHCDVGHDVQEQVANRDKGEAFDAGQDVIGEEETREDEVANRGRVDALGDGLEEEKTRVDEDSLERKLMRHNPKVCCSVAPAQPTLFTLSDLTSHI